MKQNAIEDAEDCSGHSDAERKRRHRYRGERRIAPEGAPSEPEVLEKGV